MSIDESKVTTQVQELVAAVRIENGFCNSSKIKYHSGAKPGEGFLSETYAVDIADGEKTLHLFLKGPREFKKSEMFSLYSREVLFYKTIYPAYVRFMEERSVSGGLSSILKCYATNERGALLALENLKIKGFTLFNRTKYMNSDHVELILRSFAQFHAVSFAMKDQQKEIHDGYCEQCPCVYRLLHSRGAGMEKIYSDVLNVFVTQLNPVEDRDIIEKYQGLGAKVEDTYVNFPDYLTDYQILTKGDCWINNTMFLSSPVYDIAPLFYSGATKESVDNYKYYMQFYHKELSDRIKELGSDPEILYPYSIFEKEWKDTGLFTVCLAMLVIRLLLREGEDVPDFQTGMNEGAIEGQWTKFSVDEDLWMSRVKCIAKHFIDIGSI